MTLPLTYDIREGLNQARELGASLLAGGDQPSLWPYVAGALVLSAMFFLIAWQKRPAAADSAAVEPARNELAITARARANAKTPGAAALQDAWRRSYGGIAALLSFSLVINVLRLAVPLYIFQILDRVIASRSVETLVLLTVIAIGALVTCSVTASIRRWLLTGWGIWVESHFGQRLLLAGLGRTARARPSELLRDLEALRQFLGGTSVIAWLDVLFVPGFVFVIYLISPPIAGIVLLAMGLMLSLGLMNEWLTRSSRSAATRASQDRSDWLAVAERDAKAIDCHDISISLADRWHRSSMARLQQNRSTRRISLTTADLMSFIESLLRIACYGVGVWLVLMGSLSLGGVIAAAILARLTSQLFRRATGSWRHLVSARSAYLRLRSHLQADGLADHPTRSRDGQIAIRIDDIAHRYSDHSVTLFRHVSLDLHPGDLLCIVGPSGSGKSTLACVLSGRLEPRAGMVRVGEVDVMRLPPPELASLFGYLPQHSQIFRGTLRDNIAGAADRSDDDVIAAAKLAGIHDRIVRLALGYETEIGDGATALSAGERQRIALSRALLGRPPILVLDEPEAHLDAAARQQLIDALLACKSKGSIVVVTSHSSELLRIADKAILLEDSRGTVLANREDLRRWRRQARQTKLQPVGATAT